MKARRIGIGAAVLALGLLAAACGAQEKENGTEAGNAPKPEPVAETKPVTLKFYAHTVLDDFEKYINQFVKQKFPHVTLELVKNDKARRSKSCSRRETSRTLYGKG